MSSVRRDIGGYFGMDLGRGHPLPWFESAIAVQSGRAALRLALPANPATLWLPGYFCPPVARCLAESGWRLKQYALDDELGPNDVVQPAGSDRVLLVNWFGLTTSAVDRAILRFGHERVIVDASQALFATPNPRVLTAYSPRKFVGIPDGGLLVGGGSAVPLLPRDENASVFRSSHLLRRAGGDVQGGRHDYARAEASLDQDHQPRAMSGLSRKFLEALDFPGIAERRRANARRLRDGLVVMGLEGLPLPESGAPLCWPVMDVDGGSWRSQLADSGIYCPTYWPDMDVAASDRIGAKLAKRTLHLPIDQRYGEEDIDFIVDKIYKLRKP